ncbi:MAG TPA: metal/formaldehyde-sensitive transcriptional repressor [Oxalicibacterium sp.]|nr:metal/formaldehyde-sensitive transcriptional repressor [Oxalicibacterium sp.]
MAHVIRENKRLLTRVRRIKGQTEALERALTDGAECLAALQQIAAIRGAVNGLMAQVLEDHLREHLAPQQDDAAHAAEMESVIQVLRSYLR